jgi:DNA-binding NarL/FixJ family response regulator
MDKGIRSGITVVIADDHPPIIDCLSRHLASVGFSVVGSAQNGEAALALIEQMHPLVCVADVKMPRLDGLELARRATVSAPDTAVLLYSGVSDKGLVSDALDAGAHGFALKDAPLEDLSRAIDTVAAGGLYVDPVLAAALATRRTDERKALSEREREVLRLLADGLANEEIGKTLHISPETVRTHVRKAMAKLEADTRTQAVAIALRQSIIS